MRWTAADYKARFNEGGFDEKLILMYGERLLNTQKVRYDHFLKRCEEITGSNPIVLFSESGRTELGGNHTDHNHGNVLAAGVHLDMICGAYPADNMEVRINSTDFPDILVRLDELEPREKEAGTPAAIIRGMAGELSRAGYTLCGFTGYMESIVPVGSGLSSSAAFEVLIGSMFNRFANEMGISRIELAKLAQRAENNYFGKPCGLMDQLACALGGLLNIDFSSPENPVITPIDCDFERSGYLPVIVHTGSDHSDLTYEYAVIPEEMIKAAKCLGAEFGRDVTLEQLLAGANTIREQCGDRALLRLYHLIGENRRAVEQAEALKTGDYATFFQLVRLSGDSSSRFLQNCYSTATPLKQPISVALALSEIHLGSDGYVRVHGGGFEGTIQAFVRENMLDSYTAFMESYFGKGSVIPIHIRPSGHHYFAL